MASINALLSLQINDYTLPGRTIYAPDRAPTLPAAVSDDVQWVVGLDNATQWRKGTNGSAHGMPPYYPQDYANAYDVNPLSAAGATGSGTTVALTLWGAAPSNSTLTAWSTHTGAAPVTRGNGRLVVVPITAVAPSPTTARPAWTSSRRAASLTRPRSATTRRRPTAVATPIRPRWPIR